MNYMGIDHHKQYSKITLFIRICFLSWPRFTLIFDQFQPADIHNQMYYSKFEGNQRRIAFLSSLPSPCGKQKGSLRQ